MAASHDFGEDIEALRAEVASLREDYARLRSKAQAAGRKRYDLAKDEISAAIETLKERVVKEAGGAGETIAEDVEDLRDLVDSYAEEAHKTVANHPLSSLIGAVVVGFVLGRLSR